MSARALVDQFRQGPPEDVEELLSSWSVLDAEALTWAWRGLWARPDQVAPPGRWRHWLLVGGRGAGKSTSLTEWIIERARGGFGPIRLIAGTLADVRITMVEDQEHGILARSPPDFMPTWDPSADDGAGLLTWTLPDGRKVYARGFSAERPRRLRGKESRTDAYDDLAGMGPRALEVFQMAQLGNRIWGDCRSAYTTTPDDVPLIVHLIEGERFKPGSIVRTHSESDDNLGNLTQDFMSELDAQFGGTDLEDQERRGILVRRSKSSPFHGLQFGIEPIRVGSVDLRRVVQIAIGVDPAEGAGEDNDEWGIVPVGMLTDGHMVTLEDLSDVLTDGDEKTPGAGDVIVDAALRWQAACPTARVVIVAEINRGEQRVRTVINAAYYRRRAEAAEGRATAPPALPEILGVQAKEGKVLRAGPLRPLFVSGMLHHLGGLAKLEAQALGLRPGATKRKRQDDRVDAEVHAVSWLAALGGAGAAWRGKPEVEPVAPADNFDPYRYQVAPPDDGMRYT